MSKSKKKKKKGLSALDREIRQSNIKCDTLNEILGIVSGTDDAQNKVDGIQFAILRCRVKTMKLLFS